MQQRRRHNWWEKAPEQFYVKEHDWYYTPNEYPVMWRLQQKKLDTKHVHLAQELARFFYYKMVQDKAYVDEYYDDLTLLDEKEVAKAGKKQSFYESLWDKFVPGISPLDKAINLLILLRKKQPQGDGGAEGVGGQQLEEMFSNMPGQGFFENDTLHLLMEQRGHIEDWTDKIDELNAISVVGEFGKSFEIKKVVYDKRVTNSRIHKNRRIVEYGELVHGQLYQRMMPNYMAKLITKDLVVNQPIESIESKQKIIMLVD